MNKLMFEKKVTKKGKLNRPWTLKWVRIRGLRKTNQRKQEEKEADVEILSTSIVV